MFIGNEILLEADQIQVRRTIAGQMPLSEPNETYIPTKGRLNIGQFGDRPRVL